MEKWLWEFAAGLSAAWIGVSLWNCLRRWVKEAKQDFKVEVINQDYELHNMKGWRGKP